MELKNEQLVNYNIWRTETDWQIIIDYQLNGNSLSVNIYNSFTTCTYYD
jgi:hypothetical protein